LVAALLWLTIPVAWSVATVLDRTRAWEGSPSQAWMVGWAALIGAGGLTLWTVVRNFDGSRVPDSLAIAGYTAFGLGLAASVIAAWALPIWMTLFGVALLLLARGMGSQRRITQLIGGAMLGGVVLQLVLTLLKFGTPDTHGDYPIAWTSGTIVATLGAAAGLYVMFAAHLQRNRMTT
jgi:hypothetical protein